MDRTMINEYPQTPKIAVIDSLHNTEIIDEYRWLEDSNNPAVQTWLAEQESITHSIIDTLPQHEWLIERLTALWRYDDEQAPYQVLSSTRLFFWARKKEWERWAYYYREQESAPATILLNPNEWGSKTLDFVQPSRDGKYIAFGIAEAGNEQTAVQIMDIATRTIISDSLYGLRQRSVCWLPDNKGFFYSASPLKGDVPEGEEHYWHSVYYHELGTSKSRDIKIFSDPEVKEYFHAADVSEDGRFLLLYKSMFNRNEIYLKHIDEDSIVPLITGFDAQYYINIIDEKMIIWTDSHAPNGMAYITDVDKPERDDWKILLPEIDDYLVSLMPIAGHLFAVYSHNAYTVIKIYTLDGIFVKDMTLPCIGNAEVIGYWSKPDIWVRFSSFTFPRTTYKYDIDNDRLIMYHKPPIDIDLSNYITEQVWYDSKDRTRISMFLIRHKNAKKNRKNAVYLTGYGGFDVSMEPYFSTTYALWLEAGGMIAIPNLRGGGEYGKTWHEAGMLEKKQNVFDDFIAAAEYLIESNYTTSDKLVISGASNGGLLVGAAAVQRPDLFKAVRCEVPLLDMIRYHKFGFANIWAEEYGSADDPEQFGYLLKYSPYHNIHDGTRYPAMLLIGSENDARCYPLHVMKMAARLQTADPHGAPILLIVRKKSGHGGGTTITELIEQQAETWAFLMAQVHLKK
jgi:prolyl oligopeptidase